MSLNQNGEVISSIMENSLKTSNMTPLFEGSDILINENKLFLMKRYRHKPRELTRQLMLELVGPEKLKTMTALGKTGNGIPENIRANVYKYVHVRNKHFTEVEFRSVLNYQCGTLRNPKGGKKDHSEIEKVNDNEKDINKKTNEKDSHREKNSEDEVNEDDNSFAENGEHSETTNDDNDSEEESESELDKNTENEEDDSEHESEHGKNLEEPKKKKTKFF
ncbi:protein PFC0760c-like [Leptopilina heterotoma]|nr:protein PFC0760c-like [Leptopilina heterotoma]XP_043480815.1 protein PFC0760c-like [Leptopilina heterotoma]